MKYHGTNIEVQLGDRVLYRHLLWGGSEGVVAYLPGISDSKADSYYDTPDWVVELATGKAIFMAYGPDLESTHRRINFIERGGTEKTTKAGHPV